MKTSKIYKWLFFTDSEIARFQPLIGHYVGENLENLSKEDCYVLGIFGASIQYEMRFIKDCINSKKQLDEGNLKFIEIADKYENVGGGVIDYIYNKYIVSFYSLPKETLYTYKQENRFSHLVQVDADFKKILKECQKDFKSLFKIKRFKKVKDDVMFETYKPLKNQ